MSSEPEYKANPTLGPFLSALLCEKILEEKDGIKTAVRIIDQINRGAISVGESPPSVMPPFEFPVGLLIRLKAGAARGMYIVNVRIIKPNNDSAGELNHPVHLPGPDDAGIDIVLNAVLTIDQVGTWWFDIYVGEERWTRVPLRVVYFPQTVKRPEM
jgi:hypothetical protein